MSFESDRLRHWYWRRRMGMEHGGRTSRRSKDHPNNPRCYVTSYPLFNIPLQQFPSITCASHQFTSTPISRLHVSRALLTIRYNDDLSLEDAIHTALLTLKEGFEGQMTEHTIEIGVVTVPTAEQMQEKPGERLPPTFRKLSEQEVKDYLAL